MRWLNFRRPMSRRRYRFRQAVRWTCMVVSVPMVLYIPVRLSLATLQAPNPEAILTLGGAKQREAFTAELAKNNPNLDVWISSGLSKKDAELIFRKAGVRFDRVHQDRMATDTVTNFTTMVDRLEQHNIKHVYLVTSDFHMPRAEAIATIVLGSRGIRYTTKAVPSQEIEESPLRIMRDVVRSVVWIFTGFTGAELEQNRSLSKINTNVFGQNERRQP